MRTWLSSVLGLLGLSLSAAAQAPTYVVAQRPWQGTAGMGNVTLGVSGHLTGTGHPDVVLVANGKPVLYQAPALFTRMDLLPGLWSNVTSLGVRDGGPGLFRQQLIVSDAYDLHLVVIDSVMGILNMPLGLPDWRSVTSLSLHDLTGDGISDALAIDRDGHTLRILEGAPAGIGPQRTLVSGSAVSAVTSVQWSSSRKVAYASGSALMLIEQDFESEPIQIATSPHAKTIALLEVDAGNGTSYLVWCTASGTDALVQWCSSAAQGSTAIGDRTVVGCAAGDMDADGDDDLVFSLSSSQQALVLYGNLGFEYGDMTSEAVDLTSTPTVPMPANLAVPVLADFDLDGDCDATLALQPQSAMALVLPKVHDPEDSGLEVTGGDTNDPQNGTYEVTFTIAGVPPAGATDFELLHWKLDDNYAIVSAGTASYGTIASGEVATVFDATHIAPTTYPGGLALSYALLIRPVVRDPSGTVTQVFPPLVGAFGYVPGTLQSLEALPGAVEAVAIGSDLGGLSGGGYVGFVIPPPPTFGSGTVP